MAERDAQYDPYIPAGGAPAASSAQAAPGNQRTAALQAVSSISYERFLAIFLRSLDAPKWRKIELQLDAINDTSSANY
jgi:hypothetical protein